MRKGSIARLLSAAALTGAFSVVTYAQDTPGAAGTRGQQADADRNRMVTVTGCLRAERDVPGRDESLFQRWGITQQDYVLTNVQAQRGQAGTGQAGQSGQTGHAGQDHRAGTAEHSRPHAGNMLKLEGKDADQLRQYANQRVEIRGEVEDRNWFDRAFGGDGDRDRPATTGTQAGTETGTAGQPDRPAGTAGTAGSTRGAGTAGDDDRLRSIEVQSIRAVGSC